MLEWEGILFQRDALKIHLVRNVLQQLEFNLSTNVVNRQKNLQFEFAYFDQRSSTLNFLATKMRLWIPTGG